MNDWIPFHRSLMKGRKRALARATRFIFLELCSEAREGGGMVELAPGLSLGEAVLDILGGNRKEVHQAVVSLVAEKMIDVESQPGFLVIPSWSRWKMKDLTNAERQARWRERKRNDDSNGARNAPVTAPNVTEPSPDQIRSEKRRREDLPRADGAPVEPAPADPPKTTDAEDFEAWAAQAAARTEELRRTNGIASPAKLSASDFENISVGKKP